MSEIRLRIQASNGSSHDITLPPSATIGDLKEKVLAALSVGTADVAMYWKEQPFPPKWSSLPDDNSVQLQTIPIKTNSVLQAKLLQQDESAKAAAVKKEPPPAPCHPSHADMSRADSRPRRQAAIKAHDVMAAMIEAQEMAAKAEKKTIAKHASPSKKPTNSGASAISPNRGYGNIAQLHTTTAFSGIKRRFPGTAAGTSHIRKRFRRRQANKAFHETESGDPVSSLAARLLMASACKRTADPLTALFKHAAKAGVKQQYDITLANARVAAARSGEWEIKPIDTARTLGTGDVAKVLVRFKSAGRSWVEEVIDNIPFEAANAVLKSIVTGPDEETKQMIKPDMAAQVSPKQFWTWARYGAFLANHMDFAKINSVSPGLCVDLEAAWQAIVPEADWDFLSRRQRKPSEKAHHHVAAAEGKSAPETNPKNVTIDNRSFDHATVEAHAESEKVSAPVHPSIATVNCLYVLAAMRKNNIVQEHDLHQTREQHCLSLLTSHLGFVAGDEESTLQSTTETLARKLDDVEALAAAEYRMGDVDGAERIETVLCDKCGKARVLSDRDTDLDKLLESPSWCCDDAGIERLGNRGNCCAPDDELANLLGNDLAAASLDIFNMGSIDQVTRCAIPDDEIILYQGPEGPFPEDLAAKLEVTVSSHPDSKVDKLLHRIAPAEAYRLSDAQVAAVTPIQAGPLPSENLAPQRSGFIVIHAALLYLLSAVGSTSKGANAARVVDEQLRMYLACLRPLLAHESIWKVASTVARTWQSYCRAQVIGDYMRTIVSDESVSADDDIDDALSHLEKLDIHTPADIMSYDTDLLVSSLASIWKAHDSEALHVKVHRWQRAAKQVVADNAWLSDVVSA